MTKAIKWIVLVLLLSLVTAAGIRFGVTRHREKEYRRALSEAETLYAAGDYAAAQSAYEALGLTDEAADCEAQLALLAQRAQLREAEALLEAGQYEKAKAAFLALGDFEDAAQRARECDYRQALALLEDGQTRGALDLLEALGDYPGAAEKIIECREAQYAKALEATYACRMEEAIALWDELGDYRDGSILRERCLARINAVDEGPDEQFTLSTYYGAHNRTGRVYNCRLGLLYVPDDAGADTGCMIFWPGGYDEVLANNYLAEYADYETLPNAIMLLCYANGYSDPELKIEDCYRTLERAGIEYNVFLHDLVLCGASMGAYTACQGAAEIYRDHGLAARAVLTFDAGNHWEEYSRTMSPEQCDAAAEAGTAYLLLEFGGIGMNKRPIELMVAHGVNVTIVEVAEGGHYSIITDAMRAGMIDWALGRGTPPDNGNYRYIPLDRSSTYPRGQ
ncbi:MAG: hypothetical protein K6F56_05660 [Oscillospiraceae bacterium]|nr:hypothetical protein [Oscillospiraceae bacterium]